MIKKIYIVSLLLILVSFLGLTCKKKEEKFTISGLVKNPYTNELISGAEVKLSGQKIESGILNANFNLISHQTTDNSGTFSFEFDVEYYSGFRIDIKKENYIESQVDINPDDVKKGEDYYQTYYYYPQAFLRLNIANVYPTSPNDLISYRIINDAAGNEGCCPDTYVSLSGPDVNETIICKTYGGHTITLEWMVTEGPNTVNHTHDITCTPFDTVTYNIVY